DPNAPSAKERAPSTQRGTEHTEKKDFERSFPPLYYKSVRCAQLARIFVRIGLRAQPASRDRRWFHRAIRWHSVRRAALGAATRRGAEVVAAVGAEAVAAAAPP